jgi:hypothetical protein
MQAAPATRLHKQSHSQKTTKYRDSRQGLQMRLTGMHPRLAVLGATSRQGVTTLGGQCPNNVVRRGFFAAAPRRPAALAVVANKPMYDQVAGNLENTQITSTSAKHDLVFPFQIKARCCVRGVLL